jgi:hypothetical protein
MGWYAELAFPAFVKPGRCKVLYQPLQAADYNYFIFIRL